MATTGILASITTAQACLESAYGASELAVNANNLFGMKATISGNTWASEWDGSTYSKYTSEQDTSGNESTELAAFRKYASWAASIKDHSDYLNGAVIGSSLRYAGLSGCTDYRTAAQIIKDGGYATDTAYVDKLCAVIESNNLTQYDNYDGGISMQITDALLTISNYNRPGTLRSTTTAIACNPGTTAIANRNYFENLATTHTTKASCHYIIGLEGEILRLVPEEEISWCTNSANSYSIGIEACHDDNTGKFNDATYASYVALCADLCTRWGLDPLNGGLIRHHDVTGKICPKYFVDYPEAWAQFKADVAAAMVGEEKKSGWYEENGGWRFYLGDTGAYVANNWYQDNDKWYWFDGSGMMVSNIWYKYNSDWYYLGSDGAMVKGLQNAGGKWYYLDDDGKMATEPIILTPDDNGALERYPGLAE
ncbi:Choline-binding repeat [Popillia japonica]|uniref:Choline-binding repeat n=1 Tax=Popillia japonica TaxID=7064 RepID=A0AAW1HSQ6_POPJA